jgi:heat shock transcription factor, other eukaryote
MTSQGISRKRPAPGTSPAPFQTSYTQPQSGMGNYGGLDPQVSNDQFLQFGYQPQLDTTQPSYESPAPQQQSHSSDVGHGSGELARRPASQMIPRDRGRGDSSDIQWTGQVDGQRLEGAWGDDLDDLKKRAQGAKREAQSKRKQIPPFVQKLAR